MAVSRSPRGERGLKFAIMGNDETHVEGRSPRGERGLKFAIMGNDETHVESLSSRRAWIEIFDKYILCCFCLSRSPRGERGLK